MILLQRKKKFVFFSDAKTIRIFSFFFLFENIFEKWAQGALGNVERNKFINYELIWSFHQSIKQDHFWTATT